MITEKPWMSNETRSKLRAVALLQSAVRLVEDAQEDKIAASALSLVEQECQWIAERGLTIQSEIIEKACGP